MVYEGLRGLFCHQKRCSKGRNGDFVFLSEMRSTFKKTRANHGGINMTNMTKGTADISARQAALTAGSALLLMCVLAFFAYFSVLQKLIVPGDATTTATHIVASEGLFRASIASLLAVVVLDIVVAWALYVLLRSVNKSLSLLTALLRLVYAAVFAGAIANLYNVLPFLSGDGYLSALEPHQLETQVMFLADSFKSEWEVGLAIFGIHLLLLGLLVFKSRPRILGILVMLAGAGYVVDRFGKILVPHYGMAISMFTFVGEVLLIFWLFWIGIKGVPARMRVADLQSD